MPSVAYDESKTNLQPTVTPVQMASVVSPGEIVANEAKSGFASGLQSLAESVLKFGEHKATQDAAKAKMELVQQQGAAIGQIGDNLTNFMQQVSQDPNMNDMAKISASKLFVFNSLNKANYLSAQERMAAMTHYTNFINDFYNEKSINNKDMLAYTASDGTTKLNDANMINRMLGETTGHLKDIAKMVPPEVMSTFVQGDAETKRNMLSGIWALVTKGENLEQTLNMDQKRADIALKKAATAKDYAEIANMQNKNKAEGVESYLTAYANTTISTVMNMKGKNGQTGISLDGLNNLIEHLSRYPASDSNSATMQQIRLGMDRQDPAIMKGFNNYQNKLRIIREQVGHMTDEELKTKEGQAKAAMMLSAVYGEPGTSEWRENVKLSHAGKLPWMKGFADDLTRQTTSGAMTDVGGM